MRISEATNDTAILRELGERVERARRERGWTRGDLAERSGVSERTLARLEGGASLQLATWLAVLRALELLAALDAIGAPAGLSPLALLDQAGGQQRARRAPSQTGQRAGSRRRSGVAEAASDDALQGPTDRPAWRWGDES
jgi:transcriptional regulator with XRE-family HTH domain